MEVKMTYKSNRLIFREWKEEDFDLYQLVFSNEQIMRYAYLDCLKEKEELLSYFTKVLNNKESKERMTYEYSIFLEKDNTFIGCAEIEIFQKNPFGGHGEIGYFLLPESWGKGYATEIAKQLLEIGFEQIGLHRLCASCHIDNKKSEHIMKKIGMTKEGQLRKVRFKNGDWHDELRYSVLKEEWQKE